MLLVMPVRERDYQLLRLQPCRPGGRASRPGAGCQCVWRSCAGASGERGRRDADSLHTDFVFDGEIDRPYIESDPAAPQSNYGRSKLLGEWFAADAPLHYVLRVESLFGGPLAKSSIDRIIDTIQRGEPTRVFVDRTVTPSYVADVAEATAQLLAIRPPAGLYHCVNSGVTTWLDVALEAARLLGREPNLIPINVASVSMLAKRPRYLPCPTRSFTVWVLVCPTGRMR